jgi:hypothetical protein
MWWTKRLMILLGIIPAFAVAFVVAPAPVEASAAKTGGVIVARPGEIDFHKKFAGTHTDKRTKITNTGQTAVLLSVGGHFSDYFGHGDGPGETCSRYGEPLLLPAGASCYAVVGFSPKHVSPGPQDSYLIARAYEPTSDPTAPISSLVLLQELLIPIYGETVCRDGYVDDYFCA